MVEAEALVAGEYFGHPRHLKRIESGGLPARTAPCLSITIALPWSTGHKLAPPSFTALCCKSSKPTAAATCLRSAFYFVMPWQNVVALLLARRHHAIALFMVALCAHA